MLEPNLFIRIIGYLYKGYTLSVSGLASNGTLILRENFDHENPGLSIKNLIEVDVSTVLKSFASLLSYIENRETLEIWFERGVFVSRIVEVKSEGPYCEKVKYVAKRGLESIDDSLYMSLYALDEKIKEEKAKESSKEAKLLKHI